MQRSHRSGFLALAALLAGLVSSHARAAERPVTIELDAREAPRKLFHARLTIPARPGPMTLLYPKWLPGDHGPTGPITDLAGLRIQAHGQALAWRRDPVDMYAFQVDVPAGADAIEVALDYLSPADASGSQDLGATANLALISWNTLLLYPRDAKADEIEYAASLKLPSGWKYATSLTRRGESNGAIEFEPVSLTMLVDSPVLAGRYFRVVTLTETPVVHRIDIAADSEAALAITPGEEHAYKNLIAETAALFRSRHYRHYDFLLTLSDHTAHFGLEHHESSDDRVDERSLIDEDKRRGSLAGLLEHEMVHSWNGKYRRPSGLAPGRFDEPMRGDLLWVYEGLTEYLGAILTARDGFLAPDEFRQSLAQTAAEMDYTRGRAWRPLMDTAVAAQLLYEARSDWVSWRRGTDFYPESELLWLEADMKIRELTSGGKSLDDFVRRFIGVQSGPPAVSPYTLTDVIAALNETAPYDWKGFWDHRLQTTAPRAPLAGISASGWNLVYRGTPSPMQQSLEEARRLLDARFSLGISANDDGLIPDVISDSPAAKAGLGPGMRVVAVNGKRYSREILREAIQATRSKPIELIVENGDDFATFRLEYDGGLRYPNLERDSARPDVLSQVIAPLAK
ncbi:MAG TPA: M61 family peptidase [Thermoanaerobaculia bacterium]